MSLRFASLGSGSRGNGTLIENKNTLILVDCGFSYRESCRRMERLGKHPSELAAVLVTHEHGDHIRGIKTLAKATNLPVWMSGGTAEKVFPGRLPWIELIDYGASFQIGELEVSAYQVPHDASEPVQFSFDNGKRRLTVLTDAGYATDTMKAMLSGSDALMIECNYDLDMLMGGEYPDSLKRRISSDQGHLSNTQTAEILASIDCSSLQYLVAAHLSEKNNTHELARLTLSKALGCESGWIDIACQDEGLRWREIL